MKRGEAISIIERAQDNGSFEPELYEAVSLALYALKYPDKISCGGCSLFKDEDAYGDGMCSKHQKTVNCTDQDCMDYE